MIVDFLEPKKIKDILQQIDDSLDLGGQAKLIEKLVYRYDKAGRERMREIQNNFELLEEENKRLEEKAKRVNEELEVLDNQMERIRQIKEDELNAQ